MEKKESLLEVIAAYNEVYDGFDAIIPLSARTGDGLDELLRQLETYAQPGPQLFPDGMTTDQADSQICAEIVREKMLRCLDKEIPHGTAVEVTKFSEREDSGIIDLDVTIYCEKASHKGIIIGKGRRDAQAHQLRRPPGHREVHGHQGLSSDMGKGQRELERQPEFYQKSGVQRGLTATIFQP